MTYTGIAVVAALVAVALDRWVAHTRLTTSRTWWAAYGIIVVVGHDEVGAALVLGRGTHGNSLADKADVRVGAGRSTAVSRCLVLPFGCDGFEGFDAVFVAASAAPLRPVSATFAVGNT